MGDFIERVGAARVGYLPLSSAVAAVHRAVMRDIKKHAIRVPVCDAWRGESGLLAKWVFEFKIELEELFLAWERLCADGAEGIVGIDERGIIRGDRDMKPVITRLKRGKFFGGKADIFLDGFDASKAVGLLPSPVIPLGERNVVPRADGGAAGVVGHEGLGGGDESVGHSGPRDSEESGSIFWRWGADMAD